MAILKIARMGHPVLSRPAEAVTDPEAPDLARLIRDMADTLSDAGGVGLAAPQVHVPLRVLLFFVPAARAEEPTAAQGAPGGPVPLTTLINPWIEPLADDKALGWEACLSVPGLIGQVPRFRSIRYGGTAPGGEPVVREAIGFHARVVQHEYDHLDGVLYPRRMTDLGSFGYVEELQRAGWTQGSKRPEEAG